MTQDRLSATSATGESEVDRRYKAILRDLLDLLPDHPDLLGELDAVVSEMLAEADDRARSPEPTRLRTDQLDWEEFEPVLPPLPQVDGPGDWTIRPRACHRRPRPNR
jgi:hypothetical protein